MFNEGISELRDDLANVIQGSDLQPVHDGNAIVKFADDTYAIVPAVNSSTSAIELTNIQSWA